MLDDFQSGSQGDTDPEQVFYFAYCDQMVLVEKDTDAWRPLSGEEWSALALAYEELFEIGQWQGVRCVAVLLSTDQQIPANYSWSGLRPLLAVIEQALFFMLGRGLQLIEWAATHRFCGQCGDELADYDRGRARHCVRCEKSFYPRVSPCIIVLVTRGEELLLANGVRHKPGVYSTVAGFIEPGETAEQAVHREVMEELGIRIKNLQYQCSQPWPFPHQLMLGYHAEYRSGDLVLEAEEINDARWWHYSDLPKYPDNNTISGVLIESYINQLRCG